MYTNIYTAEAAPMERRGLKAIARMRYEQKMKRNESACRFFRPNESVKEMGVSVRRGLLSASGFGMRIDG